MLKPLPGFAHLSPSPGSVAPRPFLKWAGGKSALAPLIARRAPAGFRRYHEPFLGGGAVFFALASAGAAPGAILNDANPDLVECYQAVRDSLFDLRSALASLSAGYLSLSHDDRPAFYYARRAELPSTPADRAARLVFLNHTCFNGLFRVNSRGLFNVPHGRYANPRILDEDGLRAASAALAGVELRCEDFEAACARALPRDFVYLDPPYQPLSQTARFTSYTSADFGAADQVRLRDAFDDMTARGVAALLSNSDHPAVRELYGGRGYAFETVQMSRAINSVGSARSPIPELLISNFARPEVQRAFVPPAK
jgi:DNA adenine methylase